MSRRGDSDGETRVGDLMDAALRGLSVRREVRELQLRDHFAEVIGPGLAPLCRAVSLDRGVLCVATAHGALAQQLQLDSVTLVTRLNERLGVDAVRRLRFVPW